MVNLLYVIMVFQHIDKAQEFWRRFFIQISFGQGTMVTSALTDSNPAASSASFTAPKALGVV